MNITKNETNILKGIGILTVILSHTSLMCRGVAGSVPLLRNEKACMALCEAGMSLFLFVSGYGLNMSYKEKGLKNYFTNKIINVIIPYVIVQTISMGLYAFSNGFHGGFFFNLSQLLGINSTNIYDPTMWYISFIIFWYVVFWLSYKIGKGSRVSLIIIGVISLAGFFYIPWYWGNNADYCVMTFFAGILVCEVSETDLKIPTIMENRILEVLVCAVLAIAGYTLMIRYHRFSVLTENIGAMMGMTAFVLLIRIFPKKYKFRILAFAGMISYWLYLFEMKLIIQNGIYNIWGCNYLTYAACFAGTVALSYICTRLYDVFRKKALNYVNQIRNKPWHWGSKSI